VRCVADNAFSLRRMDVEQEIGRMRGAGDVPLTTEDVLTITRGTVAEREQELNRIARRAAEREDHGSPDTDQVLGYDEHGLPN